MGRRVDDKNKVEGRDRRRDKLHQLDEEVKKLKWLMSQLINSFSIVDENPQAEVCDIPCNERRLIVNTEAFLNHKLNKKDIGRFDILGAHARTYYLYNSPNEADKQKVNEQDFRSIGNEEDVNRQVSNVVSSVPDRFVSTAGVAMHIKASDRLDFTVEKGLLGSGKTELFLASARAELITTGGGDSPLSPPPRTSLTLKETGESDKVTINTSGNYKLDANNVDVDVVGAITTDASTVKTTVTENLTLTGGMSKLIEDALSANGCSPKSDQDLNCVNAWSIVGDSKTEQLCLSSAKDSLYISKGGNVHISADSNCLEPDQNQTIHLNAKLVKAEFGTVTKISENCKLPPTRNNIMCWADCPPTNPHPHPDPPAPTPPTPEPCKPWKSSRSSRSSRRSERKSQSSK